MKQEPKTISEKKRIGYVKKSVIKCYLPNLEGQIVVNNIRKYTTETLHCFGDTYYSVKENCMVHYDRHDRYEIDLKFQGQLHALGPRGSGWYTMKEIKDNPTSYCIRRVNKSLRPKLLQAMKSKLQILGFDLNRCEVKNISLV